MQQIYQQQSDKDVQDLAARAIQKYYRKTSPASNVKVISNESLAVLDYSIYANNNLVMTGEFKRRRCNRNTFDSLMISASKIRAMQQQQLPGSIFILWDDGLYMLSVHPDEYINFRMGGRTVQFRDSYDERGEECAYFCTDEFKFICSASEVLNGIP